MGTTGPLSGIRVVELGGIGPAPFCGMLLADLGADVVRVDRPDAAGTPAQHPILHRNRRSVAVDLKNPAGAEAVLRLAGTADAVVEGFRPGVAERLGLGPQDCLARNPRLVYGRMTGWGQDGPLAMQAGHDINYIAVAGVLGAIGPAGGDPVVPLNLVGDMGGGGMLLALGIAAALVHARSTGQGQVVDAAMTDGAALQLALILGLRANGAWQDARAANILDGAAPFYRTYRCADGEYVAVGAVEPYFYETLIGTLGLDGDPVLARQLDQSVWPEMGRRIAAVFATGTREEWVQRFAGRDACLTPVLSLTEAAEHPHNRARGTYGTWADGVTAPGPAPRFSATPAAAPRPATPVGTNTREVFADAGLSPAEIEALFAAGVLG